MSHYEDLVDALYNNLATQAQGNITTKGPNTERYIKDKQL